MSQVVSDSAWVQAMLEVEAGLARVESRLGIIPVSAADAITGHCRVEAFDVPELGTQAVNAANPVVPMVAALRARVGGEAAPFVHYGATSQDVLDTAMMLVARRALDILLADLARAAAAAAELASRHRASLMAGRTLMQQASVTTFGLKAAGWLTSILEAHAMLADLRNHRLALQFGGAVGTLAALGERGRDVSRQLAAELGLWDPVMPWHTARARVAELGSAVAIAAGAAGKIALDVVLMAQTEVGEVREGARSGRGGSSTLPQKRNPVGSIEILAAMRGVDAQAGVLLGAMVQEHERAAGAWQSEWPALSDVLRLAGGALFRLADVLEGLEVNSTQMRKNLDQSQGLIMSEQVVMRLAERTDLITARKLVDGVVNAAAESGRSFKQLLLDDVQIVRYLTRRELEAALDPSSYLGSSDQLIDRALEAYRQHSSPSPSGGGRARRPTRVAPEVRNERLRRPGRG